MERAKKTNALLALLICFLSFAIHGNGASTSAPAPAPSVDCSSVITDLISCLDFVEAGGSSSKPDAQCCSGLKEVINFDADCLCEAFQQAPSLGININNTRAAALPSLCGISGNPTSSCNVTGVPNAAAPGVAPGASTGSPPSSSTGSSPSTSTKSAPPPPSGNPPPSMAFTQSPSLTLVGSTVLVLVLSFYSF